MAVHDVTPLERPDDYTVASRWYWTGVLRKVAPRARRLLVPSQWSRERCAELLRFDPDRIDVVLTGIEPVYFDESKTASSRRLDVDGPYWLHCGVAHPRKNLETAIRALATLRGRGDEVPLLARVGSPGPYLDRVRSLARDLGVLDRFVDLGSVENRRLADLYRQCDAFVFPSWEEGFGVPPLEAMASGADVLASRTSCLPEILGDTPFWGDPARPESWIEAWDACRAQSSEERTKRKARARAWASRYTWGDVAERCLRSVALALEELP
jgi:glycosyltransferase involved in cell wall biosynthesis